MSFKFTGITNVKIGGEIRKGAPPTTMCIRPADPVKAIATASRLAELYHAKNISIAQFDRRFQALLDSQAYRFVGFLRQPLLKFSDGECQLVNADGKEVGRTQEGDSFVLATDENSREALNPWLSSSLEQR